jgi:hypothetical protein
VVALEGAFHGRTAAAAAVSWGKHRHAFPRSPFDVTFVPRGDVDALAAALTSDSDAGAVAALILEPVQGVAGAYDLGRDYLLAARELTRRAGALLVFDEVQSGMGRTGQPFAAQLYGVTPDLLTVAKGLAGGFPAGAVLATEEASAGVGIGELGSTFGGGPLACAMIVATLDAVERRQFYDLKPGANLKYATLGLLFVNVSIGGTLTHFAAPPVLMVARPWEWDTLFMLTHFGWRAAAAIVASTIAYYLLFRREFAALAARAPVEDVYQPDEDASGDGLLPVPAWVTAAHMLFIAWTVFNSHYPALFLGGFLFFLGFARATSAYQSRVELRTPLLVGFFLAGLVIHGGLQGWWIAPVLASLGEEPLFMAAAVLTAFNDNALITYLATLVPNLADAFKVAVVGGAVVGGGLTVIANAPNPAGQALLSRFFDGSVSPLRLALGALAPTVIAAMMFRMF